MAFLDEIIDRLVAQGVAYRGSGTANAGSIYESSRSTLPQAASAGPFLTIIETGGAAALRTHNGTPIERPGAQIRAIGDDAAATRTLLKRVYDALGGGAGLHNITLSGTFYLSITPTQQITDVGLDGVSRAEYAYNISVEKAPS